MVDEVDVDVVRRLYPESEPVTATQASAARAALLEVIAAETSGEENGLVHRRYLGVRRLLPVFALGATIAGIVIAFGGAPVGHVSTSSAAEVLRHAAEAERSLAPGLPGAGEYLYVRSTNAYLTSVGALPLEGSEVGTRSDPLEIGIAYSYLQPGTREVWMGRSGSLLRARTGPPEFLSKRDERAWIADGRPEAKGGMSVDRLESRPPSDLSEDPDRLLAKFRRGAAVQVPEVMMSFGQPVEEGTEERHVGSAEVDAFAFRLMVEQMGAGVFTPAQRSALFEAAAMLEGIELDDEAVDPSGRPGVAVSMESAWSGTTSTLIFDPETYALIGERMTISSEQNAYGYPVGTVVGWSVYEERKVVSRLGAFDLEERR